MFLINQNSLHLLIYGRMCLYVMIVMMMMMMMIMFAPLLTSQLVESFADFFPIMFNFFISVMNFQLGMVSKVYHSLPDGTVIPSV